jgi:RimJ/RimL family protein N-acetyltransferase
MRDLTQIGELPLLSGGAITLRPWRADDAAAVAAACDDDDVARWMPLMPHPCTLADGEEWVGDAERKWREERWANFAAEDAATGALVGSCGLRVETQHERGEIGYLVHRDHRGRGVATACVALLSDWALDELGLGRIEIRADVRNVASRRTAVAAGYRYEGVLRRAMTVGDERVDDVLFSLVPGDPRPWRTGATGAAPAGLGWPRLTDGRLVVRPFAPDDAPAVQAACGDPDVAHWIYGLPAAYALSDAEGFIADARHRLLLGERARLAVTDAAGGELLGSVSLDRFAEREAAEVGYWVKKEARRRGVALGAARLVVAWAFGDLGIERLELLTYPGNEASQALAVRLGFTRECLLRGFLAPEAGKSREGRVVPSTDGSLPPRDDQVQFVRLRSDPAPPA